MKREHIFFIFVLFFTFSCFICFYRVLSPFLEPILWAIVAAITFYPAFTRLQERLKKKTVFSALFMTALVVLVIFVPLSLLVASLAHEAVGAYHSVGENDRNRRINAYIEEMRAILWST